MNEAPSESPPAVAGRQDVLRLLRLARPHRGRLALAALFLLGATSGNLAIPGVVRLLVDSVFVHHDASELNRIALLLLGVIVFTAVCTMVRGVLVAFVGNRIVADLRMALYEHFLRMPLSFYDSRRTGDLTSRLTADTTLVQTALANDLLSLMRESVSVIALLVLMVVVDWRLALVTLCLGPIIAVTGFLFGRAMRLLTHRAQEQLGEAGSAAQEALSSMPIVLTFVRQRFELARYKSLIERTFQTGYVAGKLRALFESTMLVTAFLAITGVLWYGGREVLAHHLTPGSLISFLFYLLMLAGSLQGLAGLYASFQQAVGGASRIFEILDLQPAIVDMPGARTLEHPRGVVRVDDVWFAYDPDLPSVLRGVSIEANPGERVALVGPSGAGKSTLVSLLPRFYDVEGGAIALDGHDIRTLTLDSLRGAIALVPQESLLFGGSVRENIAYGRLDATSTDIETAARAANAHEFIAALPDGYDTIIGERGVKLSGGQRQRLAIARALLKDAPVLILDEATSSLDTESEALVQEALERLMAGRTTFVIAHRLSTVENADRIVVLDGGVVVEEGTHRDLLRGGGLYARLYRTGLRQNQPSEERGTLQPASLSPLGRGDG